MWLNLTLLIIWLEAAKELPSASCSIQTKTSARGRREI